jgi:23S rRNA pseudouridine2605 synthase
MTNDTKNKVKKQSAPRRKKTNTDGFVKKEKKPPSKKTVIESQYAPKNQRPGNVERLAKFMARAGLCSRREAEALIDEGRVKVNGEVVDTPATFVSEADDIRIDNGRRARKEKLRLFLFHKPAGLLSTTQDPKGRPTIFDVIPHHLPRLLSVGRLDMNTEGLLLLTNDGELKRYLELPSTGLIRRYRVRVHGTVRPERLEKLAKGVTIQGIKYGPVEAFMEKAQDSSNVWLQVAITEGKNREVRKIMESMNLQVARLVRLNYGPFALGKLPKGALVELKYDYIKSQFPKDVLKQLNLI